MRCRPRIGITSSTFRLSPVYWLFWVLVVVGGGRARRLAARPPWRSPGPPPDLHGLAGIIVPGGVDVAPGLFGMPEKRHYPYDRRRDALEMAILRAARRRGVPVLAICRGAQILNVSRGGSIHMAVTRAYRNARYPRHPLGYALFRKLVYVQEGTQFHRVAGDGPVPVNSLHRQSIARLGDGLVVAGREENGVIQVVEDPDQLFCLGVQFHPELLLHRRVHRRLVRAFLAECRGTCGEGIS